MSKLDLLKQLREKTNLGINLCSKALDEAGNNLEKAYSFLKETGLLDEKYTNRVTKVGYVGSYVHHDGTFAALVGLKSETDFVAKLPEFKSLANRIAMTLASASAYPSEQELLNQVFVDNDMETIGEAVKRLQNQVGEKLEVSNFYKIEL